MNIFCTLIIIVGVIMGTVLSDYELEKMARNNRYDVCMSFSKMSKKQCVEVANAK